MRGLQPPRAGYGKIRAAMAFNDGDGDGSQGDADERNARLNQTAADFLKLSPGDRRAKIKSIFNNALRGRQDANERPEFEGVAAFFADQFEAVTTRIKTLEAAQESLDLNDAYNETFNVGTSTLEEIELAGNFNEADRWTVRDENALFEQTQERYRLWDLHVNHGGPLPQVSAQERIRRKIFCEWIEKTVQNPNYQMQPGSVEWNALVTTAGSGQNIVPPADFIASIELGLFSRVFMRRMCRRIPIRRGDTVKRPVRTGRNKASRVGERQTAAPLDPLIGSVDLTPVIYGATTLISNRDLEVAINIDGFLRDDITEQLAEIMEEDSISGDSAQSDRFHGIFSGIAAAQMYTSSWAAASLSIKDVRKAKFKMEQQYWSRAVWVMHPNQFLTLSLLSSEEHFHIGAFGSAGAIGSMGNATNAGSGMLDANRLELSDYATKTLAANGIAAVMFHPMYYYWAEFNPLIRISVARERYIEEDTTAYFGRYEGMGKVALPKSRIGWKASAV